MISTVARSGTGELRQAGAQRTRRGLRARAGPNKRVQPVVRVVPAVITAAAPAGALHSRTRLRDRAARRQVRPHLRREGVRRPHPTLHLRRPARQPAEPVPEVRVLGGPLQLERHRPPASASRTSAAAVATTAAVATAAAAAATPWQRLAP